MKDYYTQLTVVIPFAAKNDEQAEERAEIIEASFQFEFPKRAKWVGDPDIHDRLTEEN